MGDLYPSAGSRVITHPIVGTVESLFIRTLSLYRVSYLRTWGALSSVEPLLVQVPIYRERLVTYVKRQL